MMVFDVTVLPEPLFSLSNLRASFVARQRAGRCGRSTAQKIALDEAKKVPLQVTHEIAAFSRQINEDAGIGTE